MTPATDAETLAVALDRIDSRGPAVDLVVAVLDQDQAEVVRHLEQHVGADPVAQAALVLELAKVAAALGTRWETGVPAKSPLRDVLHTLAGRWPQPSAQHRTRRGRRAATRTRR